MATVMRSENLEGDKLLKEVLKEGHGSGPTKGQEVVVHYVGTLLDGTKFDSSRDRGDPFSFELGTGCVIKGWDLGVATMKMGEIAKFTIHPDLAYGDRGSPPTIPAKATLQFEVELLSVRKKRKEASAMNTDERIQAASESKEEGNAHLGTQEYAEAIAAYEHAETMLANSTDWSDEQQKISKPLLLSTLLNLTLACLKSNNYVKAQATATAALEQDSSATKALYRRGLARIGLQEFAAAKQDLLEAMRLEPSNADIRREYERCKTLDREQSEKSKATFARMFQAKV